MATETFISDIFTYFYILYLLINLYYLFIYTLTSAPVVKAESIKIQSHMM